MISPNPNQKHLIQSTEGVYLVDAGAGTGKTYTVTRRYANILDKEGVTPDDILLITFTNNAADEMRSRIVHHSNAEPGELNDAPIQTFHSLCHDLLEEYGFRAPTHLGIDERITATTDIIEDNVIEKDYFRDYIGRFRDEHPKYQPYFQALWDPTELLELINKLAAKGIFPTRNGWYRNSERHLDGDYSEFKQQFDEYNQPRNNGRRQSNLRKKLNNYGKDKCYRKEAPRKPEIRGDGKQAPDSLARRVFEDDRTELKQFIHDVYLGYLEYSLRRNYLNYGFLQGLAFVLLYEDHGLRRELVFSYVMIDEFQDSSEIQFKLALLLQGTSNFCVVGDWKQSIYSFQYADVQNITRFQKRLQRFKTDLNTDQKRVTIDHTDINEVRLVHNYRSTQDILDFSEHCLTVPATNKETVDIQTLTERLVSLKADTTHEHTRIEGYTHEDEYELVLSKIQDVVGNEDYAVREDGELRAPRHSDIAVLTRTRDFGRELLDTAEEYGLPMAYEGGIELFRTDQAKLLLAWLRILENNNDRGWALVLEETGYLLDEIQHILDTEDYPEEMISFRDRLSSLENLGGVAEQVFHRYGYTDEYVDEILHTIQSIYDSTQMTRGDLIRYIERCIEEGKTHEVHRSTGTDSVLVQTIHATKGLEHPIVILANMNQHKFPRFSTGSSTIDYVDPVGLRQKKVYADDHGTPHTYDDWRTDVIRMCMPSNYDEERRLLYVAATRAENHLLFTAGDKPNKFLEELPVEIQETEPDVQETGPPETTQTHLQITVPERTGPRAINPHSIVGIEESEALGGGRGKEYGSRVHDFAEKYALGEPVEPSNRDEENIKSFIDSLDGELYAEENIYLPLEIDGNQIMIRGFVDLVHVANDHVDVVDYKTDRDRDLHREYREQISYYYHVISAVYPDKDISPAIYYTAEGEKTNIKPISIEEIHNEVRTQLP